MKTSTFRALFAGVALGALAISGCVADRPSRNGVFNENQYVRKDFLTTDGTHPDPGWFLKATVTSVSTPNPLGAMGIFPGADTGFGTGLGYVRWVVTQDKLQLVNQRQVSSVSSPDNTPEVLNAWPVTNVDLKYRVNLDGEKTNFYEENQELDWQVRQWVKVQFDKNDVSDTSALGNFVGQSISLCTDTLDSSATLVPGSFVVEQHDDWHQDYMQFAVQITLPLKVVYSDPNVQAQCLEAFSQGADGFSSFNFGRQNVTFNLMYSFMRVKDLDDPSKDPTAYVPMVLDEKDPIRHKYGLFEIIPVDRDPNTNLLAARELVTRWNPNKPVTYYFASDVPYYIKDSFLGHRVYDTADAQAADTAQECLVAGCHRNPDGITDLTNNMMTQAGNQNFRVSFLNWNDAKKFGDGAGPVRQYGDVRYSFIHFVPDIDANTGWLGYGPSASDPRTGEILNATVNIADSEAKAMSYQIDFYLQSVGASLGLGYSTPGGVPQDWPATPPGVKGTCTAGQSVPLNGSVVNANHNGGSTLFTKMQQYLGKPAGTYGNLGPQDFVVQQDADFFKAYYTLIPYAIFADPDMNPFVIREGGQGIYGPAQFWDMMAKEAQFHAIASKIDKGLEPFTSVTGTQGLQNATDFINNFRDLTQNHADLQYVKQFVYRQQVYDPVSAFSLTQIADHAARHCIADPGGGTHWETKQEWTQNLITSFYEQIAIHEFGHTLGLQHNFMGSVDKPNFPVMKDAAGNPMKDAYGNPRYTLYTNSVMEYTVRMGDIFDVLQWGPYDQGALGWAYTNDAPKPVDPGATPSKSISGQVDAATPWNDTLGFQADGKTEIQYLSCHDGQMKYTPLCRTFDVGTTPSEIIANAVDDYDWHWNFTNFRVYRKFWDNHHYADQPANLMMDMRRFLMLWIYDWNSGEIADTLRRIGFQPPTGVPALTYYTQLENKFNLELSTANQVVATFHKAIIQQSTGERPTATIYDQFYGDVTQQGIILDKLFAMEFWVGIWPGTNYDPNQAGAYFSSYSDAPDSSYQTTAEDAVDSMIGGQYDAFPYFAPLAVSLFAQDTHSPAFGGRISIRNWIGGHVFSRVTDFLSYFRDVAVQNSYVSADGSVDCTKGFDACLYDPRPLSDQHNELLGPDKRRWIWAYVPDRNQYVAVQKEVNTASYIIVRAYNDDVVYNLDDGAFPGGAYGDELPMKYYLDAFTQYN
jgi:hypothetical protein